MGASDEHTCIATHAYGMLGPGLYTSCNTHTSYPHPLPTIPQGMQGGLSGGASVPWTGSVPDLQMAAQQAGLAPWQLQEAAAQLRNQQALLGMQQSASVDNLLAMQNLPQAALLLQAMNNMNAQNALVCGWFGGVFACMQWCQQHGVNTMVMIDMNKAVVQSPNKCSTSCPKPFSHAPLPPHPL